MESVLGRFHCFRLVIPFESPALCLHPQLRRGAPRCARCSLRGRPCPRRPPPPPPQQAAALCLPAPPSLRCVTVRSVRHWQKGTTTVLSMIRRRAYYLFASVNTGLERYGRNFAVKKIIWIELDFSMEWIIWQIAIFNLHYCVLEKMHDHLFSHIKETIVVLAFKSINLFWLSDWDRITRMAAILLKRS